MNNNFNIQMRNPTPGILNQDEAFNIQGYTSKL